MQKNKFKQFILITATLFLGFLLFTSWSYPIILTIAFAIFGSEGPVAPFAGTCIAYILVGIVSILPLYWSARDSGDAKRDFYNHFQEKEYNKKALKEYLRATKTIKNDVVVYTISLVLVLLCEYLPAAILMSPVYLLDIVWAFVLIYGLFMIYEMIIRPKMYDKWYADRMHK